MDLRLLSLNIKEFVPELSIPVIRQRINIAYRHILNRQEWSFLNDSTNVKLIGQHSNVSGESVLVTGVSTTVTGTGTTFTSHASGDFFRVGDESQPYIIDNVTSNTVLDLKVNYGGSTSSGEDYTIDRRYYSISDAAEIRAIVYQIPLIETSLYYLNHLDYQRSSTGAPTRYRIVSKSKADGVVTFEIWPVLDQDYVVTVFFKKLVADLSANTDEPVFRPEVLEARALWDCYRIASAKAPNKRYDYIRLARDSLQDFTQLIDEMEAEDIATSSLPDAVRDYWAPNSWDDNFTLNHDIGVE